MSRSVAIVMWAAISVLIAIVLVFAAQRAMTDIPFLVAGETPPSEDFEHRYVVHPWLAYTHIVPGILYIVGAPFQLSRRFRGRHLVFHRRFGRVVLALGIVSGVFALAFGVPFAFGGVWESLATAVFGGWFLVALLLAYRAIRAGRVGVHRRWMIRAFSVGLGVGSIRLWIGGLVATGLVSFADSFALAFWLGLGMHVVAGELWLLWRPDATGRRHS